MKKIIYSPGEPSGIGPDLIIQLCKSTFWTDIKIPILCLSDPKLLIQRAKDLGKKITLKEISATKQLQENKKNIIQVMHVSDCGNCLLYTSDAADE